MRQSCPLGKEVEVEQGSLWGGEGGEGAKGHCQGWCEFRALPTFIFLFSRVLNPTALGQRKVDCRHRFHLQNQGEQDNRV